jgi:RecJ-like exonuclease
MAQRWNIADIDKEPEDKDLPNNSDFEDDEDIDEYEEDELSCWACAGTGEGRISDSRCSYCHGRGTIKKRKY